MIQEIRTIPRLPKRLPDSHKGDYGHVLIIAGSRGMAGAAALCGASALRSGAGLVSVVCPAEIQPTVAQFEPSYMTWPLPQDGDGRIKFQPEDNHFRRLVERADVIAAGPGLGDSESTARLVAWLLTEFERPLVLDADAVNVLSSLLSLLSGRNAPVVITPHPGEFARLTGAALGRTDDERAGAASLFAHTHGPNVIVVLKGYRSVVSDGATVYFNTSGNPGMATGGAGDCLTGVIAALLGQKMSPRDAAIFGTYVHGIAGDVARDHSGEVGLIAGDIVDSLPDAFYHLGEAD